jgi:hypothetical protein
MLSRVLALVVSLLVACSGGVDRHDFSPADGGVDPLADAGPPLTCSDSLRDADETDIDCGGSCTPCRVGRFCTVDDDCEDGECVPTTSHAEGTAGQCWGDDFSGCAPVDCDGSVQTAACGAQLLVMCQWHLPAAMLDRCAPPSAPVTYWTANFYCCDKDLFQVTLRPAVPE